MLRRRAVPGFAIAVAVLIAGLLLALTVGRYPVGARRSCLSVLYAKAGRPPRRRRAGGRKRDLAGSRAARDRGDAGGCGARGRRHRVPGAVSQSAGLARHSRRIVGRGARRRGRHLSFAQRVRDPGGRLRRRADRGRHRLCDRRLGALARSDPGAGADRRRGRLAVRRRRRPREISRRSLQPVAGHDVLAARQPVGDRDLPTCCRCSARSRWAPPCWSRCAGA